MAKVCHLHKSQLNITGRSHFGLHVEQLIIIIVLFALFSKEPTLQQYQHFLDYDICLKLKALIILYLHCSCSSGWSHATRSDRETWRTGRLTKQVSWHRYNHIISQSYECDFTLFCHASVTACKNCRVIIFFIESIG